MSYYKRYMRGMSNGGLMTLPGVDMIVATGVGCNR